MSEKLLITPIKYAVHREKESPIFGETVTFVSVQDDGAGPFIVLESNQSTENGFRIDMDELQQATIAASKLMDGIEKLNKEKK
jgi:hypothetical protein